MSLKNCIETQTTVSDIASVRVPIDVVYGSLDQFIAPGTMRIIEQMRHVTMHRVEANDHLVRKRLAKRLVSVIDSGARVSECGALARYRVHPPKGLSRELRRGVAWRPTEGTLMAQQLDTTVCIAGGGPAGIVAGLILARAGIDVVVLEKHADFLARLSG